MSELTDEQWEHLINLLFQRLTDSGVFRAAAAISLANKFTPDQYEDYLLGLEEEEEA